MFRRKYEPCQKADMAKDVKEGPFLRAIFVPLKALARGIDYFGSENMPLPRLVDGTLKFSFFTFAQHSYSLVCMLCTKYIEPFSTTNSVRWRVVF